MPFSQRLAQKLAYWLGMPMGLALGCLAAIFRRGATVSFMAKSTKSDCPVVEVIKTLALASHTEPQSCETQPEVEAHHQTVRDHRLSLVLMLKK
jgi:hypothetical protein